MTIGSQLLELRFFKLQVPLYAARSEVEIALYDIAQILIRKARHRRTIRVHEETQWLDNSNSITDLDQATLAQSGMDQGLCCPSSCICCRSINLSGILARESSTTVCSPATISINNNLTTSKTSITMRSTNSKRLAGVQVVYGLLIKVLLRDNRLYYILHQIRMDLLLTDFRAVLSRNKDGVDSNGDHLPTSAFSILYSYLSLSIRS
mmetsp:Transcript_4219/g.3815  ORF Transcript_4219/g.3815 Transcript_4219/m.3815 type:complete len:207 (-) Transcript_4219:496-1116(-)